MAEAIIFTGIQASGKSSYCKEYFDSCAHISLDILKTRNRERRAIDECLSSGRSFVIDNTNPTPEDRSRYISLAKAVGYTVIGYYFSSPIAECIRRNSERSGNKRVPDIAVAATHKKLIIPSFSEGYDRLYYVRLTDNGFITEEWRNEDEV